MLSKLYKNAERNLQKIQNIFSKADDFRVREFYSGSEGNDKLILLFLEGLVDKNIIDRDIVKPLKTDNKSFRRKGFLHNEGFFNSIKENVTTSTIKEVGSFEEVVEGILSGDTVLLVDGLEIALVMSTQDYEKRSVSEPQTEAVIRGPREGFTENLQTNTSLLRRKIKNSNLKLVNLVIGEQTNTNVNIAYLEGVADQAIVEEVKKRISRIKIDGILESGYIEQLIEDAPFSLFATVSYTEKPDVAAGKLLEGRVAIFVDGTPFVLCVPYLFVEAFQTSEDYYVRPMYATLTRWLRIIAFFLTVILPAFYVAATTFHHELIPTDLLVTLAAAREGVPFPSMVEVLIMGLIFEILKEAGIRLPRAVGQAVSIVGAVVIGEAAVTSGLIGAPVVMITAITAISSYVIPSIGEATPILRLFLVFLSGALGIYGIMLGISIGIIHLCSLRSLGVPYLSPFAPITLLDLKDSVFVRAPIWTMITRPRVISRYNRTRQRLFQMPRPRKNE
ncbi:MAG: spore germination protein [Firmicutes bacterium HGW-Firmicutes-12]|jgi:spore germination protein KA|nr:MAG: spore germination protein [Firmicutes bacterium HGW-Firmicutes-12]